VCWWRWIWLHWWLWIWRRLRTLWIHFFDLTFISFFLFTIIVEKLFLNC
jgi:hypothetical protein